LELEKNAGAGVAVSHRPQSRDPGILDEVSICRLDAQPERFRALQVGLPVVPGDLGNPGIGVSHAATHAGSQLERHFAEGDVVAFSTNKKVPLSDTTFPPEASATLKGWSGSRTRSISSTSLGGHRSSR